MKLLAAIEKNQNAIIGALIIHVLIFVWLNIQNISFYVIQPKEKTVATFDFTQPKMDINENQEIGNNNIDKGNLTNLASNYVQNKDISASEKKQLEQDIINEVKNFEQSQFKDVSQDNPILQNQYVTPSNEKVENIIINKSIAKSSSATAKYFCKGRKMILQKIPSYLCDATGLVRLNIKVSSKGLVTDCKVDFSKTNTNNECLIKNAINYANNWKFDQDFSSSQKQIGWIEFAYISQ